MNKLLIVGVLAALVLGGVAISGNKTIVIDKNVTADDLGAVMPYISSPELNLGGLRLVGREISLATGTSTVCAIQSPAATSTLISGGVKFRIATTSATAVDITNSTTRYATSSAALGAKFAMGASEQALIVASSSPADNDAVFAPSQWFVVKYGSYADGTGNVSTGNCWAVFATP